jgi:hypothetical protein
VDADGDADSEPTEDAGLELTEAEVASDQQLAVRTVWAALTGYAVWIHPALGAAVTAATPIFEKIATFAVRRLGQRRIEHAAETLLDAADAADEPLPDFIDRAVADDRRHELLARTLTIAQDTALRNKRRALGRALAAGVMGDEARIDEELLFIRAVADIDEMHIRLLAQMVNPPDMPPGWSALKIVEADPGLSDGVRALLGTLELHGLIAAVVPGSPIRGPGAGQTFYNITESGRRFLDRLADDTS